MNYTLETSRQHASGELAGQRVSAAFRPHTREINGHPTHEPQDAGMGISLQGVPGEALSRLLDIGMGEAETATRSMNGTTFTAAAFDPKSNRLWLRSRGDSPAYIVLHDRLNDITAIIRITHPGDARPTGRMLSSLSEPYEDRRGIAWSLEDDKVPDPPPPEASHEEERPHYADYLERMREKYKTAPGHLDLDAFRKKVAEHFGMEPLFTNATLVVATDGLSKGLKLGNIHLLQKSGEHETINIALERMKELAVNAHGENWRGAAGTVADFARGQTKDDITLMAMPLIAGRGDPVALAVADGYGKKGEFASWRGINTFEAVLKQARENAASQMASEEQRRADEAERLEMHEHNRSADTQEHLAAELRQMPLPGSEVVNVTELLTHVQRGRANS